MIWFPVVRDSFMRDLIVHIIPLFCILRYSSFGFICHVAVCTVLKLFVFGASEKNADGFGLWALSNYVLLWSLSSLSSYMLNLRLGSCSVWLRCYLNFCFYFTFLLAVQSFFSFSSAVVCIKLIFQLEYNFLC